MLDSLRFERVYPYHPEQVWVALTDRHALAEWLMPNDFEARVGHKFTFQVDPMPGCVCETRGEVLEVVAAQRLVYSWTPVPRSGPLPSVPSVVTWTLTPTATGTRLTLEHTGLAGVFPFWQRLMLRFGWGTMVKRWIPKVAGNVRDGQFVPGVFPLAKRCYKANKIPAHLTR